MSGNGAYQEEMTRELSQFVDALRAAVPARPDLKIGESLVPRLAQTARAATIDAETRSVRSRTRPARSRRALVARVGIAVAMLPLLLAGLAFAGVTLPEPARSAFESVGIDLPNQPSDQGSSSENGSGKPASGKKAKGKANAEQKKHHGRAKGRSHGNGSHGKSGFAPGHTGSAGAQSQGNSNSGDNSSVRAQPVHPVTPIPHGRGSGLSRY
jgi:hypothetical protein